MQGRRAPVLPQAHPHGSQRPGELSWFRPVRTTSSRNQLRRPRPLSPQLACPTHNTNQPPAQHNTTHGPTVNRRPRQNEEPSNRDALQEAKLLSGLSHPNIIKYRESFIDPADGSLCIVTSFCAGGDLFSAIRGRAAPGDAPPATRGAGGGAGGSASGSSGSRQGSGRLEGQGSGGSSCDEGGGGGVTHHQEDGPRYFSEDEVMDLFLQVIIISWSSLG
jgi:hypothetical protein